MWRRWPLILAQARPAADKRPQTNGGRPMRIYLADPLLQSLGIGFGADLDAR